ncbi:MAG TPA: glutamine-hydrolyzing carbamoyl-phosphate synthase small subunit [Rhizomicrobium sp.]|jgi:carbamoyl-phosphate synthase small subunit|nr:glutamine-hydrolyzing carbamoyl-phosphate synthase small subunit [Rhizomicrobium sp.]
MTDIPANSAAHAGEAFSGDSGVLVLADGTVFEGRGFGAPGHAVGEVCFNTAMTGYEEILTDPSYAGQIITFTFPHIGIVGTNGEDIESANPAARAVVVRADTEHPSNWRALSSLDRWLKFQRIPGVSGIDTRALAARIRAQGMPHGVVAHSPDGRFDIEALTRTARAFPGLEGLDLAREVTCSQTYTWREAPWKWSQGYRERRGPGWRAVVIDYGVKRNILRQLAGHGADITVLPAGATLSDIMRHEPHGVLLSNGPGDPAAMGDYAIPTIAALLDRRMPILGICLGHQLLALALGAQTRKMAHGHHGANHPVKDLETGRVEIVSMNHGFTVDGATLPKGVRETHVSLFDGSNCGLALANNPAFSVQYHPEASPGPMDSHYLFERFAKMAAPLSP